MSLPTSRDRRDKPEVNIAHVRPMVIKEPVSMATQWSLSTSEHLSRMENHVAPSLTASALSSTFPFMPRDMSPYQQPSMMNALPPFHLLPGNDVFHAGLPTSYPHYTTSLSHEEFLHRDVIGHNVPLLHSHHPYVLNNNLIHHIPYHPMNYPYGFVKDNSNLEPYRPLVLSKPNTLERRSKLEKLPMSQINDPLAVHPHSPPTKRKCHLYEKIWDHKAPPDKKGVSVPQITDTKPSHHRDTKCVLRVPEIKPQHSTFTHTKRHEESNQPAGEALDLSLKRKKFRYDEKDIPSDRKKIGPEPAMRTALTKVSHMNTTGNMSASASCRMDSVIRMAPRLDKVRRDEGFNTDNCRISHAVPINNAADKHSVHRNHIDKGNQQAIATNNSVVSSKLDYENTDKRRRRKQNKPQYHKQESETVADVSDSPNKSHHENMLPSRRLESHKTDEHDKLNQTSQVKEVKEVHTKDNFNVEATDVKNNELLRGDCHQVLLAQHVLNQVTKTSNVGVSENVTQSSGIETNVQLNVPEEVLAPKVAKKKRGPAKTQPKSFNVNKILGKSHNGVKQGVGRPKKRGRKPKNSQGQQIEKPLVEPSDSKSTHSEAANYQALKQVTNEIENEAPKLNETCISEQCTQPLLPPPPPKRKRGRPRKSESLASGNGAESIGKGKANGTEQNAKKGRRAGKKVQTHHKKVRTSRSKPMMPLEENGRQTKSQGPKGPKRCAVLLCKLQMGGRRSIKLNEISSVSHCVEAAEANKHIIRSKSQGLSLEQTKALNGKDHLDGSSFGLLDSVDELSEQIKQGGRGPGRRKKRSCGYPYSPLLFAIGHCPLPHCVACKGHTAAVAKNQIKKRRKRTQTCKLEASGDQAKVTPGGCCENGVYGDQLGSDVVLDGSVITAPALNITCIKEIDQRLIKHSGYYPNPQENYAQYTGLADNQLDKSNNNDRLSQFLINIPGSNQLAGNFQENMCGISQKNVHESLKDDDGHSVMSDQTELCEEEEVDIEGVENLSPPFCGEPEKVEGYVDSSVQLENQCIHDMSLSDQQEGQTVLLQETSAVHKGDGVKCGEFIFNKLSGKHYTLQGSNCNAKQYALVRNDVEEIDENGVYSDPSGGINHRYDVDINVGISKIHKEDWGVREESSPYRSDSLLECPEEQNLKGETYDVAPEMNFLEDDRHIVAYKGIVTLDETENAEMYPSGVYVSSVV